MKILIAPDSFKDSLSALHVAEALKTGLYASIPDAVINILPLADGGEGSLEALISATGGRKIKTTVIDPLQRDIQAHFGILGDEKTAVIELAKASGIELLVAEERNPWITTTYGTGQLIKKALDKDVEKIIMCIGGSATNDGGAGIAQALGARLLSGNGNEIPFGGGHLDALEKIDLSYFDARVRKTTFVVACDVTNPLCGKNGASHIYGSQKGAGYEMIKLLDANLRHYAKKITQQMFIDILEYPGSGAAGGTGAGLMAFCNAKLQNGFSLIAETLELEKTISEHDIIITGEGKIDEQTQYGKVPFGVAQLAEKYNKPVIAVAGTLGSGYHTLYNKGIDIILSIIDKPMSLKDAIAHSQVLLENTGKQIGTIVKTFSQ